MIKVNKVKDYLYNNTIFTRTAFTMYVESISENGFQIKHIFIPLIFVLLICSEALAMLVEMT